MEDLVRGVKVRGGEGVGWADQKVRGVREGVEEWGFGRGGEGE